MAGGRLEKWRNKSEQEKHTMAIAGASVFTAVVGIIWFTSFVSNIGSSTQAATASKDNAEQFSPLAQLSETITGSITRIKDGASVFKDSAAVLFSHQSSYTSSSTDDLKLSEDQVTN